MKSTAVTRVAAVCFCLLLNLSSGRAQEKLITFPVPDGAVSANPALLAFAYGAKIGVTALFDRTRGTVRVFTWSLDAARVVDEYDLQADFGVGSPSSRLRFLLKTHSATGLIVAYGADVNGSQKVVALRCDPTGRLSRLWAVAYPPTDISISDDVAFNEDGSTVYLIYNKTSPVNGQNIDQDRAMTYAEQPLSRRPVFLTAGNHIEGREFHPLDVIIPDRALATVVMLRANDGVVLATSNLGDGGNLSSVWFDSVRQRLIAVAGGTVYVFGPGTDQLVITASAQSLSSVTTGIGFNQDGRFFLAYAGHDGTSNRLLSFDLDLATHSTLEIVERFAPSVQSFVLHRASGIVFAPLSVKIENGVFPTGSRIVNIVAASGDGTLRHQADAVIPKRSEGITAFNLIRDNNAAVSASGALGFVSASTDRVFAFDALSGDIVNELRLPPSQQNFIQVLDPPGLVVSSNGDAIILTPIPVNPTIKGIVVKKKQTIIEGANFLSGARVSIDGSTVDPAERNPENPGHEILLPVGKARFTKGREFSIVVTNRDGLPSSPFTFSR